MAVKNGITKPFLERLQAVHAELVDIAKTPEMQQIIEVGNYRPDFTIDQAIDAVSSPCKPLRTLRAFFN